MQSIVVSMVVLTLVAVGGDFTRARGVIEKFPVHHEERIMEGMIGEPEDFPYQAVVWTSNGAMCGGSIISKRYILTAAHCVQKHFATLTVILGSKNRTDASEEGQVRISTPGTNKIIHPDWDKKNYDIALIKLEEDIIMTDRIQPIDLPSFSQISESFAEQIGIASGFGRDYPMPFRSDLLIYAGLRVMSVEDCKKQYPNRPEVVCGDSSKGATCSGDSGGPYVVGEGKNRIQIGITAFGVDCSPKYPSAFTRVSLFVKWIAENSDVKIKP